MWVLEGLTGQIAGTRILLRPAAQCVVGRERDCAVCLDKDMSVSRTHAKFEVHQGSAPGKSTLVVTDSSRFGTFVGASGGSGSTAEAAAATIKIAEPAQLHDGDVVAFGSKTTSLRVLYVPIRVAFSGVKGKLKQELLDIAKANDVVVFPEFCDDCDYLVVSTLKVTVKVVLAVALRRAIVSYEWLQALRDGTTIPDPSSYLPQSNENQIDPSCFQVDDRRRDLFQSWTFFFCDSAEFDSLSSVVRACGGSAVDLSDTPLEKSALRSRLKGIAKPCIVGPSDDDARAPLLSFGLEPVLKDNIIFSVFYANTESFIHPCITPPPPPPPQPPLKKKRSRQNEDENEPQPTRARVVQAKLRRPAVGAEDPKAGPPVENLLPLDNVASGQTKLETEARRKAKAALKTAAALKVANALKTAGKGKKAAGAKRGKAPPEDDQEWWYSDNEETMYDLGLDDPFKAAPLLAVEDKEGLVVERPNGMNGENNYKAFSKTQSSAKGGLTRPVGMSDMEPV